MWWNAAARTDGRSLSTRDFATRLERLARTGGGRVYFVRTTEDLTPIFASISEELRSHYLITYYPEPGGGPRYKVFVVGHGARESIEVLEIDTAPATAEGQMNFPRSRRLA